MSRPLHRLRLWITTFARFVRRENLHRVLLVLLVLSLLSALALSRLEPATALDDWMWWSVVTLTTVGYGDVAPTSALGRMIGIVLMVSGIGVLSAFTASIASFFIDLKLKSERGMRTPPLDDHIILCEWNDRAQAIYEELRADPATRTTPIALISSAIEARPMDDDDVHFVRGEVGEETLRRASVERAATVILLGDDREQPNARDAKVVLATLTVETLRPEAYTIVELMREENAAHCRRAHADEIVVAQDLSSRLIASAARDHGLTRVLSDLLSGKDGQDLQRIEVAPSLVGRTFFDALRELKMEHDATALALMRGEMIETNPAAGTELRAGDHLIVVTAAGARVSGRSV
ncbi:MAG: ion channel [Acidobacteriota bacterium]